MTFLGTSYASKILMKLLMLAIMSDRDRWIAKKEAEAAKARYNQMLYEREDEEEEDDGAFW